MYASVSVSFWAAVYVCTCKCMHLYLHPAEQQCMYVSVSCWAAVYVCTCKCMHLYLYPAEQQCMYVHVNVCICMRILLSSSVCMYLYLYPAEQQCMSVSVSVSCWAAVYVCICICILLSSSVCLYHVCMYVCIYLSIYLYHPRGWAGTPWVPDPVSEPSNCRHGGPENKTSCLKSGGKQAFLSMKEKTC